jgi:hypothetical protein
VRGVVRCPISEFAINVCYLTFHGMLRSCDTVKRKTRREAARTRLRARTLEVDLRSFDVCASRMRNVCVDAAPSEIPAKG